MMEYKIKLSEVLNVPNDEEAITHGGIFHADDVFATALLKIVKPDIRIKRVIEVPESFDGLVYDIGFGEYDHHQADKRARENGTLYAAFGLLWEKIGPAIVGKKIAERIDKSFVEKIDLSDNTGRKNLLSDAISALNPSWNEDVSVDERFEEAVELAKKILERKIENEINNEAARDYVMEKYNTRRDNCVVLDKGMPWKSVLIGTDTEFVIYPSVRGGYMLQTVPNSEEDYSPVVSLPKEWYGIEKEQLRKVSGVESITFCHATGFVASAEKLSDIWKMIAIAKMYQGVVY